MNGLFMPAMIKKDGLINKFPRKDWEDKKENLLRLVLKSIEGDDGKEKDQDNRNENKQEFSHLNNILYLMRMRSVK